jgi:protein CpxP
MKKLTVFLMSIALVAVGAIFVFGQTTDTNTEGKKFGKDGNNWKQGKRGMRGGHKGMGMMFRGLDLTDAQKEQMKSIGQASRESTKSLRDQMKANRQQLEQATANGAFNEAQVQAIAQQQGALHAQIIVERQKVQSQMFNILTPEQKAKAAEMKEQFKQKMEERKSKRAERQAQKAAQ